MFLYSCLRPGIRIYATYPHLLGEKITLYIIYVRTLCMWTNSHVMFFVLEHLRSDFCSGEKRNIYIERENSRGNRREVLYTCGIVDAHIGINNPRYLNVTCRHVLRLWSALWGNPRAILTTDLLRLRGCERFVVYLRYNDIIQAFMAFFAIFRHRHVCMCLDTYVRTFYYSWM